jgi:hypothetical protein
MTAELALASSGMTTPFPHRGRWRNNPRAVDDRDTKQGRSAGGAAFFELADDALGNIAHCVNRTDHLLLADHHIVEQAYIATRKGVTCI